METQELQSEPHLELSKRCCKMMTTTLRQEEQFGRSVGGTVQAQQVLLEG